MSDINSALNAAQPGFNWLQPLASLAATFLGAFLAYSLAKRRESQKEHNDQFAAYNRSLAVLLDMYNSLETYRQDVVAPFQGKPDSWLNAPISLTLGWGKIRFDHDALVFVLETKHANIFPQLLLVESNFEALANLIQKREDILLKEVHPKLARYLNKPIAEDKVTEEIGSHIANQLKNIWNGIANLSKEQIDDITKAIKNVGDAAAFTHPGRLTVKTVLFRDGKLKD